MKLLIIGAGTFSTEVEELAKMCGYSKIAFIDDNLKKSQSTPVVGKMSDISLLRSEYENAIVALGNNENRKKYFTLLEDNDYNIPILIHKLAYISPDAIIEKGVIIRAMAVVGRYARIGRGAILNIGAKVDHHCNVGDFCHLQINSVVRNSMTLAPLTWIDAGNIVQ